EHHGCVDAVDQLRQIARVTLDAAQGVGPRDHGVMLGVEEADDALPARRVLKGSMDEDDRRRLTAIGSGIWRSHLVSTSVCSIEGHTVLSFLLLNAECLRQPSAERLR